MIIATAIQDILVTQAKIDTMGVVITETHGTTDTGEERKNTTIMMTLIMNANGPIYMMTITMIFITIMMIITIHVLALLIIVAITMIGTMITTRTTIISSIVTVTTACIIDIVVGRFERDWQLNS